MNTPYSKRRKIITITIDRKSYEIDNSDVFMDNGACIQLLTQNKSPISSVTGRRSYPVISTKKAMAQMGSLTRIQRKHKLSDNIKVFSVA